MSKALEQRVMELEAENAKLKAAHAGLIVEADKLAAQVRAMEQDMARRKAKDSEARLIQRVKK